MEFSPDQEIVLDIIKSWLDENDAAYLAKEDLVVYWGNPTGDIKKKDWIKWRVAEIVNIIKSTKVPVGVMKHCTPDMFKAACQEEGRTYICGVEVHGEVKPEYFNYNRFKAPTNETVEHRIAVFLLSELQTVDQNILWSQVVYLFEQALKYCKVPLSNAIQRNKFLRYGVSKTDFKERRATGGKNNRYTVRKKGGGHIQYTCIKLDHRSGIYELSKDEMRKVIIGAVESIKEKLTISH